MTRLAYALSYRELIVYQKARELSKELFHLSKTFPREEMYSLTDQLRRSSRSVGGQIAEAWAKRRYELGISLANSPMLMENNRKRSTGLTRRWIVITCHPSNVMS